MNYLRLIALTATLSIPIAMQAQDTNDIARVKEINKIKKSNDYLYAESTTKELESAVDNALSLLEMTVEEWAKAEHQDINRFVIRANNDIETIRTRRGDFYRVFVYIKKKDVLPVKNNEVLMVVAPPVARKDEIVKEAVLPPVYEDPPAGQAIDEIKSEAAEEFVFEMESVPDPKPAPVSPMYKLSSFDQALMSEIALITDFSRFYSKRKSSIREYGKYPTPVPNGDCYVLLYDNQKKVQVYMHQTDGRLVNLWTLQEDSIDNYKNYRPFWVRLK